MRKFFAVVQKIVKGNWEFIGENLWHSKIEYLICVQIYGQRRGFCKTILKNPKVLKLSDPTLINCRFHCITKSTINNTSINQRRDGIFQQYTQWRVDFRQSFYYSNIVFSIFGKTCASIRRHRRTDNSGWQWNWPLRNIIFGTKNWWWNKGRYRLWMARLCYSFWR